MSKVSFLKVLLGAVTAHMVAILLIAAAVTIFPDFDPKDIKSTFGNVLFVSTFCALSGVPTLIGFWPFAYYGLVDAHRVYLVGVFAFLSAMSVLTLTDYRSMRVGEFGVVFSCLIVWLQIGLWYIIDPTKTAGSVQTITSGDNSVNAQVNGDLRSK